MLRKMPQALILDFGGVVTRTLFETHRQTEQALNLPAYSLTWPGPFAPEKDMLWRDMQAGKISERDYWCQRAVEVGKMLGKNWTTMQEFIVAARSQSVMEIIRPEFFHCIECAKKSRIRLAILSNELDLFYGEDFREKLPFLNDFETIIDATYSKILKPDPRAYNLLCQSLDLPPELCVFVDDQFRNVRGAEDFGMQAIHFDVCNPAVSYGQALMKFTRAEEEK